MRGVQTRQPPPNGTPKNSATAGRPLSARSAKRIAREQSFAPQRQRKEMTPSEKQLWRLLRSIDGHTFRRQPEVGPYIFDFGQYAARLLIEIDGSIHRLPEVQENDKAKEIHAVANHFRVMRFVNNDVWDRPAWVVSQVRTALNPSFSLAEKVAAERPDEGRADAPAPDVSARPSPPNPLSARERGGDEP